MHLSLELMGRCWTWLIERVPRSKKTERESESQSKEACLAGRRDVGKDVGRVQGSGHEGGIAECEQRRRVRAEKPHLQESWTLQTNGDRLDFCLIFLIV